jgi:hypothetical protein
MAIASKSPLGDGRSKLALTKTIPRPSGLPETVSWPSRFIQILDTDGRFAQHAEHPASDDAGGSMNAVNVALVVNRVNSARTMNSLLTRSPHLPVHTVHVRERGTRLGHVSAVVTLDHQTGLRQVL